MGWIFCIKGCCLPWSSSLCRSSDEPSWNSFSPARKDWTGGTGREACARGLGCEFPGWILGKLSLYSSGFYAILGIRTPNSLLFMNNKCGQARAGCTCYLVSCSANRLGASSDFPAGFYPIIGEIIEFAEVLIKCEVTDQNILVFALKK